MLVFVDESEWPRPSAPEGYTVWAGIAIEPENSKAFSREIFLLEKKFWNVAEPHEFEIKGRLLLNKRALTSPKKVEFVEELLSLCKQHGLHAFAVGLRERQQPLLPSKVDKEFRMYPLLLERVEQMMNELHPEGMAILLFDSRGEGPDRERALAFGNFIYGHTIGKLLQRILNTPFFVASITTPGIQIADLFAYALAQQNVARMEPPLRRICDRIRELEWRSNRTDTDYPLRGFRFIDLKTE